MIAHIGETKETSKNTTLVIQITKIKETRHMKIAKSSLNHITERQTHVETPMEET